MGDDASSVGGDGPTIAGLFRGVEFEPSEGRGATLAIGVGLATATDHEDHWRTIEGNDWNTLIRDGGETL